MLPLACCGCGGTQVPEEIKNLCPASVTVMDGDQPVKGILVTLSAKGGQGAFACNGVADDKGVAQIRSTRGSHTGKGAPEGTYAVVLSETIVLPSELEPQESDQDLSEAAQAAKNRKVEAFLRTVKRSVPVVLTATGTSPVELVVAKGQSATIVIDVAKHRQVN
jgi:hypothetical protein